jgi:hypothetical protein
VTDIEEIEVVDYDYRGTYESSGFSDEADIPGCLHPQIQPPLETFTSPFGNRTFEVNAFTNISIMTLNFDYLKKEINLNVTVPPETTGFATLILENAFLRGPYSTSLDGVDSKVIHANTTGLSFLYLEIPEGSHTVGIIGTEFFGSVPEIRLSVDKTAFVGETVTFDASRSSDDGRIVSYKWDLGDGTKNAGKSVNHTYMEEGTYQVLVNLTDNDGLSSVKTFEMTIQNRPMELSIVIKVLLASISGLIILMMIILVLRRKKK